MPDHERIHGSDRKPVRAGRWAAMVAYSLTLVLLTVLITRAVITAGAEDGHQDDEDASARSEPSAVSGSSSVDLAFGSQDIPVDSVTIPAGTHEAALLYFDVSVGSTPTATPRAAMVGFRVECRQEDELVEIPADGKLTTNVFLAHGGEVSGQALTAPAEQDLDCTLLASAPFIETTDDGLTSLPIETDFRAEPTDGTNHLALHRLKDATLVQTGSALNVLSLKVDDPATLDRMSTTVRLTSCTVVGGSRDGGDGENQCLESMTGRESSTVRVRVIARWLDDEGEITGTTTFWDETLAIDYHTHHIPWTLRQGDLTQRTSDTAEGVVLVVQVESLAGTPFVVHADGTDSIVTTGS